ncbi:hypothetical protein QBC47DRAFT_383979 [Echria macrotheca]|uniref:NACHT domain-containing protein n=1 Tax=Echria macrotheca TaxID=438768 RepID=A0AAJ0BA19_9PEZI|nr:hypothetical protein QBC47DRAFT_383979 [Echria macrotheca]
MDPVSAIGLAAAIVAFVDFSHKLVSGTLEVFQSGKTTENAQLGAIVGDLHSLTAKLNTNALGQSEHEQALASLALQCQEVSKKLVALLGRLKTENGTRWESARVALRSMRKKSSVRELEDLLGRYRSQILVRLGLMLNDHQLGVHLDIQKLLSQSQEHFVDLVRQLTVLRDEVLAGFERTLERCDQQDGPPPELQIQLQLTREIRDSLLSLLAKNNTESPEIRILKQIAFKSIHYREDSVDDPESDTFRWMIEGDVEVTAIEDRYGDNSDSDESENSDWDTSDDEGQQMARKYDAEAQKLRTEARNMYLKWLREGENIFHISGKAGSGKSTMMKLLLQHPRTLADLKKWAGEKQLIFGHFFFWRAGDKMQRSLEGLYRSMLFQALKQRPKIIPMVFPTAYQTFSAVGSHASIDTEYFRARELTGAFSRLISLSTNQDWKLVFFIDGLDEYGEDATDRLDHLELAKKLEKWVAQDGVKILVTSRPYSEFRYSFTDGIRIDLHTLTADDIFRFGQMMFLRHRSRPLIDTHYVSLLRTVVDRSDGVFLWARLAIRYLLVALPQHNDVGSLEKYLDNIPPGLQDLYTKLLTSINPAYREKSFKLLLLVVDMPDAQEKPDLGLIVLWIEHLTDPTWPMSCDIHAYSDEELTERYSLAERQLDSITMGLLEMEDLKGEDANPFFRKRVQFFHRTVRDFVRQSAEIQELSARWPDLTTPNTYARLLLAELWFCESKHLFRRYEGIIPPFRRKDYLKFLRDYESELFPDDLLDGYWKALDHHQPFGVFEHPLYVGPSVYVGASSLRHKSIPNQPISFLHWVASSMCQPEYLVAHVSRRPELQQHQGNMSLLFSACHNWLFEGNKSIEPLKALLDLGASLDDPIRDGEGNLRTVWAIVLPCFFARILDIRWTPHAPAARVTAAMFKRLEYLLAVGQPDVDCVILLRFQRRLEVDDNPPTHFITPRELVRQLRPPNSEALLHLMGSDQFPGDEEGVWGAMRERWSGLVLGNRKTHRDQRTYTEMRREVRELHLPFRIEMEYPGRPAEIFSIRWAHAEVKLAELWLRLY